MEAVSDVFGCAIFYPIHTGNLKSAGEVVRTEKVFHNIPLTVGPLGTDFFMGF